MNCFDLLLWVALSGVGGTTRSAVSSWLLEVVVSADSAGIGSFGVSLEADSTTECEKTLKIHY